MTQFKEMFRCKKRKHEKRTAGRAGRMVSFRLEKFGFGNSDSQKACCSSARIGTKMQAPFLKGKIVEPRALFDPRLRQRMR
jgi:hypothetical protein